MCKLQQNVSIVTRALGGGGGKAEASKTFMLSLWIYVLTDTSWSLLISLSPAHFYKPPAFIFYILNYFVSVLFHASFRYSWLHIYSAGINLSVSLSKYNLHASIWYELNNKLKRMYVSTGHTGKHDEYLQWSRWLWQRGGEWKPRLHSELRWAYPEPPALHQRVPRAGPWRCITETFQPVNITHFSQFKAEFALNLKLMASHGAAEPTVPLKRHIFLLHTHHSVMLTQLWSL